MKKNPIALGLSLALFGAALVPASASLAASLTWLGSGAGRTVSKVGTNAEGDLLIQVSANIEFNECEGADSGDRSKFIVSADDPRLEQIQGMALAATLSGRKLQIQYESGKAGCHKTVKKARTVWLAD